MNLHSLTAAISCALLIAISGCSGRQTAESTVSAPLPPVSDISETAMHCADSALALMDIERKSAQLFMPAVYASSDAATLARIREYASIGTGGIILLKGDARSASVIADSMRKWSATIPFIAIDAEWGLAMRLHDTPEFPANSRISENADEELLYEYGNELARECRRLGINMVLGPVLDVSAKDTFMGRRSFGADPERVGDLAIAYARGLEAGNVLSVAKHFPGHGAAEGDSHKGKPVIERSLHSIDSIDMLPFRRYIEQRLSGIMVGHISFPAIDPEMLPAAVSKTVITDLLRDDLDFGGLILTDAMNMLGAEGYGADMAVAAGADMILAPADTRREIKKVVDAVRNGDISQEELDTHVRRVLFRKYLLESGYLREPDSADSLLFDINSPEAERIRDSLSAHE